MKTYATLTDQERQAIIYEYKRAIPFATDPLHAAAIAGTNALHLTGRQVNGRAGSEAFAAAVAVLVFRKVLSIQ